MVTYSILLQKKQQHIKHDTKSAIMTCGIPVNNGQICDGCERRPAMGTLEGQFTLPQVLILSTKSYSSRFHELMHEYVKHRALLPIQLVIKAKSSKFFLKTREDADFFRTQTERQRRASETMLGPALHRHQAWATPISKGVGDAGYNFVGTGSCPIYEGDSVASETMLGPALHRHQAWATPIRSKEATPFDKARGGRDDDDIAAKKC
uniref:Uncharacterized protein n=1 Tax=Timema bartmani TaxID=61472 RepID=A0A7R9I1R6_9NEOP|nr:unnamed protein product [Timema bartmani]